MGHWISTHQLIFGVGLYYVFSNAVQGLPVPDEKSSKKYRWFFVFGHGLAGNVKYALSKAAPQYVDPTK